MATSSQSADMQCLICFHTPITDAATVQVCLENDHRVCRSCLSDAIASAIQEQPPALPFACIGRHCTLSDKRCPHPVSDALIRSVLSPSLTVAYDKAVIYVATSYPEPLQTYLWTPCCVRPFEIDRRDCSVVPRILPCPYGCRSSMCTGCDSRLTLEEQRAMEHKQLSIGMDTTAPVIQTSSTTNDASGSSMVADHTTVTGHSVTEQAVTSSPSGNSPFDAHNFIATSSSSVMSGSCHDDAMELSVSTIRQGRGVYFSDEFHDLMTVTHTKSNADWSQSTSTSCTESPTLVLGGIQATAKFADAVFTFARNASYYQFPSWYFGFIFRESVRIDLHMQTGPHSNSKRRSWRLADVARDLLDYHFTHHRHSPVARHAMRLSASSGSMMSGELHQSSNYLADFLVPTGNGVGITWNDSGPLRTPDIAASVTQQGRMMLQRVQQIMMNTVSHSRLPKLALRRDGMVLVGDRDRTVTTGGQIHVQFQPDVVEENISDNLQSSDIVPVDHISMVRNMESSGTLHDHSGPMCFRTELHEPAATDIAGCVLGATDKVWSDDELQQLFRRTCDAWAPQCPVCRRLGLKSGSECNAITCRCGTQWCFMCSKEICCTSDAYLRGRSTKPDRVAFMLQQNYNHNWSSSSMSLNDASQFYPVTAQKGPCTLSSLNHHSSFNVVPGQHRHDPFHPGKSDTLCPSTLEQLAIVYNLPEFVEVRNAYYYREFNNNVDGYNSGLYNATLSECEDTFQDGIEFRLLPAFLRLRAICALRTLQQKLPHDVFIRGLALLPDWRSDELLCQRLGVETLTSVPASASNESSSSLGTDWQWKPAVVQTVDYYHGDVSLFPRPTDSLPSRWQFLITDSVITIPVMNAIDVTSTTTSASASASSTTSVPATSQPRQSLDSAIPAQFLYENLDDSGFAKVLTAQMSNRGSAQNSNQKRQSVLHETERPKSRSNWSETVYTIPSKVQPSPQQLLHATMFDEPATNFRHSRRKRF